MSTRRMKKTGGKMKIHAWNRVSRYWKLALNGAAILLLLFGIWIAADCPFLTAKAAFRGRMEERGWPKESAEVVLRFGGDSSKNLVFGLRADGTNTYYADMEWDMGWRTGWYYATVPAVDGICYMPLIGLTRSPYDNSAFAVKESGTDASLTLILGESEYGPGGRFPLVLREARDGWFVFDFDTHFDNSFDTVYCSSSFSDAERRSIKCWVETHDVRIGHKVPASLKLTTRDADGTLLREITWKLP